MAYWSCGVGGLIDLRELAKTDGRKNRLAYGHPGRCSVWLYMFLFFSGREHLDLGIAIHVPRYFAGSHPGSQEIGRATGSGLFLRRLPAGIFIVHWLEALLGLLHSDLRGVALLSI